MFKQRDNEYHPPMTVDPSGGGVTTSAGLFSEVGMGSVASPFLGGPAVAAGSRKRGRDIRGLDRFRTVVYGEDGFRRLHAMVARNPVLMYPPDGIEAARARVMVRKAELQSQLQSALGHREHNHGPADDGDEDVFALFEARRRAESDARPATEDEEVPRQPASEHAPPPSSLASIRQDEELAIYHHKQLDSYLRLLYEFNHATFVKLPLEDTLQLLSRCGKEAVAHIVEYETQVRLRRQSRIRDLNELRQEQAALEERRLAIEDAEQARLVQSAELRQAQLDLELDKGVVKAEPPDDGSADEDVKVILETAAPSVDFASLPAGDSPEEYIDGIVMAVEDEGIHYT
ncbi:conserved hypothetical protein [Leishmania infantum JPCM5]|uniref:Uncharacterized protein n=2 Tax=Leishmania infantum TaxID=5671 RepID=A4HVL7_LEIIN|nr:conserved hypothetical protein [Leishmania infantum JPCM5]CAC9465910.1 hypothetical_protein_-_conserved [Leishmania infantum]CAM66484.1 conserved hypothetical protein [Leishmania infantum JPCM5]SUZ40138.1 hypothetical_protein_-_conserved [Leishmania infantum]|eukprot:XP_001464108.1 conserved hypothetical protein [Leishmania infantum JPCM5]